jgi:hypothetical protein
MVKLLLSRGANINAFDKKDRRAIHWAAYMGMYFLNSLLTYVFKNDERFSSCHLYNISFNIVKSYAISQFAAQVEPAW